MSHPIRSRLLPGLASALAVFGLASASALIITPGLAGAVTVPLATSSFSIDDPGSLSGTSGQAITPIQLTASNVDASTSPATTTVAWSAGQLPAGLVLSATGTLSGTPSASIPAGSYDVKVIAAEKVTSGSRGQKSVNFVTADFTTKISISGVSASSSDPTPVGSGFASPYGVAVDTSGHVFVADTSNNQIVVMNADGTGQTTIGFGFSRPCGVAVDTSGHVFVADTGNHQIVAMNADGTGQTPIGSGFTEPCEVAVDTSGHVFVADFGPSYSRIVKMNTDGTNQTDIGSGFAAPYGVAVDTSGHVFVADTYHSRIVKMNTDGTNQTTIGSGFNDPFGVAVDSSGQVFVTDSGNQRIVKMNTDGTGQTTIGSGYPFVCGVAVDTSGRIFVADTYSSQIVLLNAPGFSIPDQVIPSVQAGQALAPTQLVSASVDPSTSPTVTSVKWFGSDLPAGIKLSSSGVLSGTPKVGLVAGTYSIYVAATEKVTTKVGKVKTVSTKTTSRTLPIVIS